MSRVETIGIVSRVDRLDLKRGRCVWSGYKETLKDDQTGQTKFVSPTDNRAAVRKSGLECCAMPAETGACCHSGNSTELNTASRSHCRAAVIDAGNSAVLRGLSEQTRGR